MGDTSHHTRNLNYWPTTSWSFFRRCERPESAKGFASRDPNLPLAPEPHRFPEVVIGCKPTRAPSVSIWWTFLSHFVDSMQNQHMDPTPVKTDHSITGASTTMAAWLMLTLGVAAQAAGTLVVSTPAYLIPYLLSERGLSLADAGMLAAAPTLGMVFTLVAWGAAADRFGERWVIAGGLAGTALFMLLAVSATDTVGLGAMLGLAGAASACSNAATGRVVVGWFPRPRRGLAMGIRQMSQPLGVAAAALTVPMMAAHHGLSGPLVLSGITASVVAVACAVGIRNPPRAMQNITVSRHNPYKGSTFLWRIHAVSMLLVAPQFTLSIFGLVWLTSALGWAATPAGIVIALAQFLGALGRIAVGHLSDRTGSRVTVLRWVAFSCVAVMLLLALTGWQEWALPGALALTLATVVSVADNGLAFTSVAEAAGPRWSGRALGIQNTGQFITASAVGPVVGSLVGLLGYPAAFALAALTPLIALPLIPARDLCPGTDSTATRVSEQIAGGDHPGRQRSRVQ